MRKTKYRLKWTLFILVIGVALIGLGWQCPWSKSSRDKDFEISSGTSARSSEAIVLTSEITIIEELTGSPTEVYTSLAVDSENAVHISYYDDAGNLKYATNADGCWGDPVVIDTGNVGEYCSIALDSNDRVHISYYDATATSLKYATNAGAGNWLVDTVDDTASVGKHTSIAVDANNKVHISYYDEDATDLKYATNESGTWVPIPIHVEAAKDVGKYTSLALDSNDNVHISYYEDGNNKIKYITNAGGSWAFQDADPAINVGEYSSIAVDSYDQIHISYYDGTGGSNLDIKYVVSPTNGSFEDNASTVNGASNNVGKYTSIGVDSTNRVHISYYDATNYDLRYAVKSATWSVFILDHEGMVGEYTSLGLDADGQVHICYYDATNAAVKYVMRLVPPAAPSGLNATAAGSSQIDLTWTDNADNEDGFDIERQTTLGGSWSSAGSADVNGDSEGEYTDEGLAYATTYSYRVRSYRGDAQSPWSNIDSATTSLGAGTAPRRPSLDSPFNGATEVSINPTLYWKTSVGATSYTLQVAENIGFSPTVYDDTVGNNTQGSPPGLNGDYTQHWWRVKAQSAAGYSPFSVVWSFTTEEGVAEAPEIPTLALPTSGETDVDTDVTLDWDQGGGGAPEYYALQVAVDAGFSSKVVSTTVNAPTTSYDASLMANTQYWWQVRAANAIGSSDWTSDDFTTTVVPGGVVPTAPSNLIATAASYSQIDLDWDDNSDTEMGFQVYRDEVLIATIESANTEAYADTGLEANTAYTYTVCAYNVAGVSAFSNEASDTTDATPGDAPTAPMSLAATAVSESQVDLSWTDAASDEEVFKIYREGAWIADVNANITSYSDYGLTPDTYDYEVSAYNSAGESAKTSDSAIVSAAGSSPDNKPAYITATTISHAEINLSWVDSSTNEQCFWVARASYVLWYDGDPNYVWKWTLEWEDWIELPQANITSYTFTGLEPATYYYFRVLAFNSVSPPKVQALNIIGKEEGATTLPLAPPADETVALHSSVSGTTITVGTEFFVDFNLGGPITQVGGYDLGVKYTVGGAGAVEIDTDYPWQANVMALPPLDQVPTSAAIDNDAGHVAISAVFWPGESIGAESGSGGVFSVRIRFKAVNAGTCTIEISDEGSLPTTVVNDLAGDPISMSIVSSFTVEIVN